MERREVQVQRVVGGKATGRNAGEGVPSLRFHLAAV